MFIQQYNGYYYLTEKRCGQVVKIYLGTTNYHDWDHSKQLLNEMITRIERSQSYLWFVKNVSHKELTLRKILTINFAYLWAQKWSLDHEYKMNIYKFVYHSNKSEGSKIAYNDFENIIYNRKPTTNNRNEIQEVKNSFLARDFLMEGFVRNEANIKKLHKILTKWLIGDDGNSYHTGYKKHNNLVGNALTTDYVQVADAMKSLLLRYQKNKKALFPLHLAFEFHYKFERIHPFSDGNGRIWRLLMNKILYDNKFIPLTIFSENRAAYFRAFEKSIDRWSFLLYEFLIEQYKKTLWI